MSLGHSANIENLIEPGRVSRRVYTDPDVFEMEMQRLYGANVPEKHQHDYGFKTESGAFYSLVRTPLSEALLTDTNLHSKILVLKGRAFPKSQLFEVTGNLHSLRDGKLNELYYYCDICSIKGSVPGPCLCCREPVHLVEEPAK